MADSSLVFAGRVNTVSQWTDASGYGNHAIQSTAVNQPSIVSGGTSVVMNATRGNSAYHFDGAAAPNHKCFYIPYNDSLSFNNNWTISCWIKCQTPSHVFRLFSNYPATPYIYIQVDTAVLGRIRLYVRDDAGNDISVAGNKRVDDDLWHNVVCQRRNNYLWIYIDGEYDNRIAETLGDCSNTNLIYIGANYDGVVPYKGYMIAPRFWQRPLGVSEIVNNYRLDLLRMRC